VLGELQKILMSFKSKIKKLEKHITFDLKNGKQLNFLVALVGIKKQNRQVVRSSVAILKFSKSKKNKRKTNLDNKQQQQQTTRP